MLRCCCTPRIRPHKSSQHDSCILPFASSRSPYSAVEHTLTSLSGSGIHPTVVATSTCSFLRLATVWRTCGSIFCCVLAHDLYTWPLSCKRPQGPTDKTAIRWLHVLCACTCTSLPVCSKKPLAASMFDRRRTFCAENPVHLCSRHVKCHFPAAGIASCGIASPALSKSWGGDLLLLPLK